MPIFERRNGRSTFLGQKAGRYCSLYNIVLMPPAPSRAASLPALRTDLGSKGSMN